MSSELRLVSTAWARGIKKNADGSIDIYFSNEKPEAVKSENWVKTLPDQGFFVYMRYYGPLKAFNDKTWVPNDVELVK